MIQKLNFRILFLLFIASMGVLFVHFFIELQNHQLKLNKTLQHKSELICNLLFFHHQKKDPQSSQHFVSQLAADPNLLSIRILDRKSNPIATQISPRAIREKMTFPVPKIDEIHGLVASQILNQKQFYYYTLIQNKNDPNSWIELILDAHQEIEDTQSSLVNDIFINALLFLSLLSLIFVLNHFWVILPLVKFSEYLDHKANKTFLQKYSSKKDELGVVFKAFFCLEERIQVEHNLNLNQNRFLSLLMNRLPMSIFIKNSDLSYEIVNTHGCQEFHLDLTQNPLFDHLIFPEFNHKELKEFDLRCLELKNLHTLEEELIVNGETQSYLTTRFPIILESGELGLCVIRQNISERKRVEDAILASKYEAEAGARSKSQFLAMMSHEIRTPMNGIMSMTGLLLETPLNEEQKEWTQIIRVSSTQLLTIINDILDFSKIEAGRMTLEEREFSVRELAYETMAIAIEQGKQKLNLNGNNQNIQFKVDISDHLTLLQLGDSVRIRQILLNFLSNAVKFTTQGIIHLNIDLNSESTDPMIEYSVSDTGIGMSAEAQAQIFQPFAQADSSITRRFGGTGLGLVISKQLVELMHGQIGFESIENQGSRFWFRIPCHPSQMHIQKEVPQVILPQELEKATLYPHLRILVAEDNLINQKVLSKLLAKLNYQADFVVNGLEAVYAYQNKNYDLIFMDVQMPEMDGLQATQHIRNLEAKGNQPIRIFALTANAFQEDKERALEAGMDLFLTKPITLEKLKEALLHFEFKTFKTNN